MRRPEASDAQSMNLWHHPLHKILHIFIIFNIQLTPRSLAKDKKWNIYFNVVFHKQWLCFRGNTCHFSSFKQCTGDLFFPLRTARLFSYGKKWIYLRLFHYLNNIVNIQIQSSSILRFSIFFFFYDRKMPLRQRLIITNNHSVLFVCPCACQLACVPPTCCQSHGRKF